jgi:hypothetical protein
MNARLPLACAAGCGLLILHAAPAKAQDINAEPTFGSVSLSSGFSPDPYIVAISAGGSISAADVASDCVGYVASAPDFSLHYDQEQYALSILADAGNDITLLVNDPGGDWHCSDDSSHLDHADPGVFFPAPRSGRYDIWVGTYSDDGGYVDAVLMISEQGTENWRSIVADLRSAIGAPIETNDPPPMQDFVTAPGPMPGPVTVAGPGQVLDPGPAPVNLPESVPDPAQASTPTEGVIQYGRKIN